MKDTQGQTEEADGYGEGVDSGDKAPYKAITGGRKYALASLLGLATSDDPERDQVTPEQPAKPPQQPAEDPAQVREKAGRAVQAFGTLGLVQADLERYLSGDGEPPLQVADWTGEDLQRLRVALQAIEATPAEKRKAAIATMFALPSSALEG